jgi:glycine hydroxymethyltransferase
MMAFTIREPAFRQPRAWASRFLFSNGCTGVTMSDFSSRLAAFDPEIAAAIHGEERRQADTLDLIASENHTHPEVLAASGSVLADKYAEGYPGRRYYAGQEYYDVIERLAISRAKVIFRAEHANVQPLSGSPMNQAVYFGLLSPGDTILAMDLSHGGHLTHGAPASHMGKIFRFARYRTTGMRGDIDMGTLRALALEHRPKLLLCGHSSYPREIDYAAFKRVADEVNAISMADVSHIGGLIAGGALRNPLDDGFDVMTTTTHKTLRGPRGGLILCREQYAKAIDQSVFPGLQGGPHMQSVAGIAIALKNAATPAFAAYCRQVLSNAQALATALAARGAHLITGGTENHLLVVDVARSYALTGAEAQRRLESAGIVTNKQVIPDDPAPPMRASGIRLGTPAATSRGMQENQMATVASWIDQVLRSDDASAWADVAQQVKSLCAGFPVPSLEA